MRTGIKLSTAGDGTLGTADFTGKGIFTQLTLTDGERKSFDSMAFGATVGTGQEVRFDEFYVTTDLSDIVGVVTPTVFRFR